MTSTQESMKRWTAALRRAKQEVRRIEMEIDIVQTNCDHNWYSRSVMGRDTETKCLTCGLER